MHTKSEQNPPDTMGKYDGQNTHCKSCKPLSSTISHLHHKITKISHGGNMSKWWDEEENARKMMERVEYLIMGKYLLFHYDFHLIE